MSTERVIELQEQSWRLQADGRLDEASSLCREALHLIEECEGPSSPDVANVLNDLAEIELERQHFTAVLALTERARSIEDALGDDTATEAAARIRMRTLTLAAEVRRVLGDYPQAEGDQLKALALAVAEFGRGSAEAAAARNDLGVLYKYWGRFDDGLRLYREALASIVVTDGESSLSSAVVYHNIGGILHARGDFTSAEAPARKAWDISRQLLGEGDPRTVRDAVAYAAVLDGLERYDESERIYRTALAVFERVYGPTHVECAALLHNLATLLDVRGHRLESEHCHRRALEIKETVVGAESPDVALTRNNLGRLLIDTGRQAEARPLLEAAVRVLEHRLPPDHPHVRAARENLRRAQSGSDLASGPN